MLLYSVFRLLFVQSILAVSYRSTGWTNTYALSEALLQCQVCLHPSLLEARHVPSTAGSIHPCINMLLSTSRSPGGLSARRHLGAARRPGLGPDATVGRPPGDLPARGLVDASRVLRSPGGLPAVGIIDACRSACMQASGSPVCPHVCQRLSTSVHPASRKTPLPNKAYCDPRTHTVGSPYHMWQIVTLRHHR